MAILLTYMRMVTKFAMNVITITLNIRMVRTVLLYMMIDDHVATDDADYDHDEFI